MSRFATIFAACLVIAPDFARACAVCGAGLDEDTSRTTYLVTTGLLSVLPLALFGGFLLYLRAKARRRASHSEARPAS